MVSDPFDPVQLQEREIVDSTLQQQVAMEGRLRVCRAVAVLKQSNGWKEYAAAIRETVSQAGRKIMEPATQNREYWAGYTKGLSLLVTMMDTVDAEIARLELQLQELRAKQDRILEGGRVKPGGY